MGKYECKYLSNVRTMFKSERLQAKTLPDCRNTAPGCAIPMFQSPLIAYMMLISNDNKKP